MDVKDLFFGALRLFKERNPAGILAQALLQHGKQERWLAREFSLAMNAKLTGKWGASQLDTFTECELAHADISVWELGQKQASAVYEVKALYSRGSNAKGEIAKASRQLGVYPKDMKRVGLFFVTNWSQEGLAHDSQHFDDMCRDEIRNWFHSDKNICLSELLPETTVKFQQKAFRLRASVTYGVLTDAGTP